MPHRPEGQGSTSLSPGGAVVSASSVYTPPRVTGSTAAAIMRQQTSSSGNNMSINMSMSNASQKEQQTSHAHSSGVVTPVIKKGGLAWLTAGNKSSDSMDRSLATTDDSRSIATLATEDEREATASALLMVAKVATREQQQHYLKGMVVESSIGNSRMTAVSSSASTVPLKKRKKSLDILRRQQHHQTDVEKGPCHVSPVSHDPSPSGNRAQSYDSNEASSPKGETTQELLDSAKVHSTAQIGAGASLPMTPHFPTVLHQVLANKDLTTEDDQGPVVIRWLPDGETWKVENWNAMRRQVLPKYFSDLTDEHGSSLGTIDAFLHYIEAWGFEEIKNGPNAGAYRHNLFIRGAQKLCVKMRFNSHLTQDDHNDNAKKVPKTVSVGRSSLQVPILATQADSKKQQTLPPNKRPRFDNNVMGLSGHGALHWPYSNESAPGMGWGGVPSGAHFNSQQDIHNANARAFGMRAAVAMNGNGPFVSQNGPYNMDPRLQQMLRGVPGSDSMTMARQQQQPFQYNPPQVRSGRGALRGMASATQQNRGMATSPSTTPSFRHGFPVSNRGKGSRKSALSRTPLETTKIESKNSSDSAAAKKPVGEFSLSEAQRIGKSVKGGVAVAISRKTKRKLPMAGKKANTAPSATQTELASVNKAAV